MTTNSQTSDIASPAHGKARGAKTEPQAAAPATAPTKGDLLVTLLSRAEGASIADMQDATGWMAHSVRGFMAGTLRKRMGHNVASEKTGPVRIYRIVPEEAA